MLRRMTSLLIIVLSVMLSMNSLSQSTVGSKYDMSICPNNPFSELLTPDRTLYHEDENWAADTIISNDLYPDQQLNMKIQNYSGYYDGLGLLHGVVTTLGFVYDFYEERSSIIINITQREQNISELNSDRTNFLSITISLIADLTSRTMSLSNFNPSNDALNGMIRFSRNGLYILRFNGDGLIMFKDLGGITAGINYNLGFYPGYFGESKPIKVEGQSNIYNKEGYSALFLDNYGGFGTYVFPKNHTVSVSENVSGTFPSLSIYNILLGDIVWIATCPPKAYDWTRNSQKVVATYGYVEMNVLDPSDVYRGVYPINLERPDINYSSQFINDLTVAFQAQTKTILLLGSHISAWGDKTNDNWHLAYHPKIGIDTLNTFLNHLDPNIIKLMYTSPGMFFKDSRFYNADNPAYYLGRTDLGYKLEGDPNIYDTIPLCTTIAQLWNNGTSWPRGRDNPGNPYGANLNSYLAAVSTLKSTVPELSGIYLDWYYVFNIPRSYMLARELRRIFPSGFIFAHSHGLPGGDAYLPQIDSYFDLLLRGESGQWNYQDFNYFRYFCSGYNISNTPSVFIEDMYNKKDTGDTLALGSILPQQYFEYANLGYKYTAPQMVGEAYNSADIRIVGAKERKLQVDNLNNSLAAMGFKDKLIPFYATEQVKYQTSYNAISQSVLSPNDKSFSGDFNGDGSADILRVTPSGELYVSKGVKNLNSYIIEKETKWGQITSEYDSTLDRILVGDFNADGQCDMLHLKWRDWSDQNPNWFVYLSYKDTTIPNPDQFVYNNSWIWWNNGYWFWDQYDKVFANDFDGDGKCDVMKVEVITGNYNWEVARSSDHDFGSPPYGVGSWINLAWTNDDFILTGDFNSDDCTDIMKIKRLATGDYRIWKAMQKKGENGFGAIDSCDFIKNSVEWFPRFYTAKLTDSKQDNLIYYAVQGVFNVYSFNSGQLNYSGNWFEDTNSTYEICNGRTVLFGDFSGDGWTDICIIPPGYSEAHIGINGLRYGEANFGLIHDWHISDSYLKIVSDDSIGYTLRKMWNLISIPLEQSDMSPIAVFGDDLGAEPLVIFAFSQSSGGYFDPSLLELGKGYWMNSYADSQFVDVAGVPLPSVVKPLEQGWNIIGNPFTVPFPINSIRFRHGGERKSMDEAIASGWIASDALQGFGSNGYYLEGDTLHPWQGYWFIVTASDVSIDYNISFEKSSLIAGSLLQTDREIVWSECIQASLNTGQRTVYDRLAVFGSASKGTARYDRGLDIPRPPRVPDSIFVELTFLANNDSSVQNGFSNLSQDIRAVGAVQWPLMVRASHPGLVTLSWDAAALKTARGLTSCLLIDGTTGVQTDMRVQSTYLYTQTQQEQAFEIQAVSIAGNEIIPNEFRLYQCYPNPFNLSTIITFALPSKSFVTLNVFDILGRKVATIVSENLSAGKYSKEWKALGISSGIYFYRLQAGNYSDTKKLILLK